MKSPYLSLSFVVALFISCADTTGPQLNELKNPITFSQGQTWKYSYKSFNVSTISYFVLTKDTFIDSLCYFVIEGTDSSILFDTIHNVQNRKFLVHSDKNRLKVIVFRSNAYVPSAPLRKCKGPVLMDSSDINNQNPRVSTDIVDIIYPVQFPIKRDSLYEYRMAADYDSISAPFFASLYSYLGQEWITVKAGKFQCYKLVWYVGTEVKAIRWISELGLIKMITVGSTNETIDSVVYCGSGIQ